MVSPVICVTEYGSFDSGVKFPGIRKTNPRVVEEYELEFYFSDCTGQSCINGIWYPVEKGTMICAKPGDERKSLLPYQCSYVHFTTRDSALIQLLSTLPSRSFLRRSADSLAIFREMITAEVDPEGLFISSCVFRLILIAARHRANFGDGKKSDLPHRKTFEELEGYVSHHLSEDLSLPVLAARCNLSPIYFHRLFKNCFGKTPAEYVSERRIAAAKELLLMSDLPPGVISADCGFSSQAYFCYQFKKVTGKTPLQYRNELLGKWVP